MKYLFAVFLAVIGIIIIIYGDKPMKIKKGKIIQGIDSLTSYGGKFKKLTYYQKIMFKITFGLILIFFSVMIFLNKH